ncbi:MAG: right-handed parallel beta-helix repeat-containing protein [Anaerolineaceae bacterium]
MSKKLFGKFFVFLLVVGLLFAVAPKQAQAQTVSTWDGTYPAVKPLDMPAVVGGVQEVTTAAQFAWLASQPTMFETGVNTVKLMVDIDLAEYPWTPSLALKGAGNILDGNYHTIQNLRVTVANTTINASYYAAMFVGNNNAVLIKNLTIDDAVIGATDTAINNRIYSAVLFSHNDWYGDLENVTVKNSSVYGTKYVAALVDYGSDTNIKNCTVQNVTITVNEKLRSGSTLRDEPHIGALIGLNNDGDVSGNTVSGLTINLTPIYEPIFLGQTGGLIGTAQAPVLVGANNVSGVTLNGTTYSTLIGLDKRTYKVVNATQMLGYTTIQAAINAAAIGDTIQVAAGTYEETVDIIDKDLTLIGQPGAIIKSPVEIPARTGTAWKAIVFVHHSNATIDGFTIDGAGRGNLNSKFLGVQFFEADGVLKNSTVTNVTWTPFNGAQEGIGFYAYNAVQPARSVSLQDNTFVNNQKGDVNIYGSPLNVIIDGNTFTGHGNTSILAQNGVSFQGGATGSVKDNSFSGYSYSKEPSDQWNWGAAGLLLYGAGDVTLGGENNFTGNDNHLYIYDSGIVAMGAETFGPSTAPVDFGYFVVNYNDSPLDLTQSTFPVTDPFDLAVRIWDGIDEAGIGLASFVDGHVYVNPDGSIQRAIDLATAGDIIHVAAGTYAEDVLIDKSLTILGPNSDISPVTGERQPEAVVTSFRTQYSEAQTGVTIKGFEVTGQVTSTGTLAGIYVGNTQNVTIEHNYIHDVESHGIAHFDTPISNLAILDNKLVNISTASDTGIYVGFLTNATIADNVIDTTDYAGINITAASTGVDILRNIISNTAGVGIQVSSGLGDVEVSGNIISNAGNGLNEADKGGIRIYGSGLTGLVSVYDNTISGSQNGIGIKDSTSCNLSYLDIYHNSIATTNEVQVYNGCTDTSILDVTVNWWESITGPTVGKVVGTADYTPWCANAECTEFLPAQVTIAQPTSVVCGNTTETTIDIYVAGIPTSTPLQGYSFYLEFDENKVSIGDLLSFQNGGFLDDGGFQLHPVVGDLGKVQIAYTAYGVSDSVGGGKLATIPLNLLGVAGDVSLVLSGVELSQFDQQYLIPAEVSTTPVILTLDPAVINTTQSNAGYCDLASAVAAANAGNNLELQANIDIPTTVIVNKALTLDLNGKTATAGNINALHVTTSAGDLTITDSTTEAPGKIISGYRAVLVSAGGSLTLQEGTLQGNGFDGVFVFGEGSSVTVKGGIITGLYYGISGNGSLTGQYAGSTTIVIDEGIVQGGETAIFHPQGGRLTINGGEIIGGSYNAIEMKAGDLIITGGTITATGLFEDEPAQTSNGNTQTGDAILIYNRAGYLSTMTVDISGGTITSTHGYALREFTYDGEVSRTTAIDISGGTFTGGLGVDNAGAAVTFMTVNPLVLNLTGGLYNTDPADPTVYVFVPYGTKYNGTMYEIVGISLNVDSFYYNNNNVLRGVSADFTATNFVYSDAISVTVELFSGTDPNYVAQQTNVLKTPDNHTGNVLTSSFDIFGTYVSNSWNNSRQTEYGQNVPPTRVLVTVVLPGGTLTAEKVGPSFEYSLIDPVLVAEDFAYMNQSGVRGVTAGFHPVNFTLDQVLTLKVELFAGTQLLQTNISPVPSVHGVALLQQFSGPFDIFGSFDYETDYATGTTVYWENTRETEYGQTLVPTRVLATVTLPGGVTRTVENTNLTGTRTDILPVVNGFVSMQGRFAGTGPRFGVPLMLKDAANVEYHATSSDLTTINYGFAGLELLEYTFTTNQPRYLNIYFDDVDDENGVFSVTFTLTGDRTLPELRLRAGNAVWTDNVINTLDAGKVGTDWNKTFATDFLDSCGDVNFDGYVNIQDLALVGGNYELTSASAYGAWLQ